MKRKHLLLLVSMIVTLSLSGCTWYNRRMSPQNQGQQGSGGSSGASPNISSTFEKADLEYVVITDSSVPVKNGTHDGASTIANLTNGTKLKVLGKSGAYYACQLTDNRVGVVPIASTKPSTTAATQTIPNLSGSTGNNPSNDEASMLSMVNAARTNAGVKPLAQNMELTKLARLKSKDIVDKNYFSHTSPTYGSPFDMMRKYGVSYLTAGENLAKNQSTQAAFQALMNSEGHRKNILSPDFTEIGIGIISGGDGTNVYTQMFIGK
jgi:uncharacterized protein, YkwD family